MLKINGDECGCLYDSLEQLLNTSDQLSLANVFNDCQEDELDPDETCRALLSFVSKVKFKGEDDPRED